MIFNDKTTFVLKSTTTMNIYSVIYVFMIFIRLHRAPVSLFALASGGDPTWFPRGFHGKLTGFVADQEQGLSEV